MAFAWLNSGVATRRGFAFAVVKPALKRGATLDCRYRGKEATARWISTGTAGNPVGGCSVGIPTDEI